MNDKDASLAIETVELKSLVGQVFEENQKLKVDMFAYVKENFQLKEIISKLIRGKQSLNQVLSILVNFQKRGLGYTLNKKTVTKPKNLTIFIKATNNPSTSQSSPRAALKSVPRTTSKPVNKPPPKF